MSPIRALVTHDAAENSIMQTISIAVSALLIAAGSIGAPSMINAARNASGASTVQAIVTSEQSYIAKRGAYTDSLSDLIKTGANGKNIDLGSCGPRNGASDTDYINACRGIHLVTGGDLMNGWCFQAFLQPSDGADTLWYAQSKDISGETVVGVPLKDGWPASPTAQDGDGKAITNFGTQFDASCGAWPATLDAALGR